MRVAANIVEKVLMQAEAEVREQGPEGPKRSSSYDNLVAAFKRAAELRDKPYRTVTLRGRHDRIGREVIITNQEKGEAGFLYALCLVPYTQKQLDTAGTYVYATSIYGEDGKVISTKLHDSGLTPCYHEQWIRLDRIRQDAFKAA